MVENTWPIIKLPLEDFPSALMEIPEPPKELYLQGRLPDPEIFTYLTIVGSRRLSRYGQEVADKLIRELAGQPVAIVSGLAIGIDTLAHKLALEIGLPTVALPGSGLDRQVIHPHSNCLLANQIVETGGALLSEFPPEYPAGLHTFPRRNRLMAGLSKATLVIEAGEKSGTLITARLATDYNRELLAVPGSIFSPLSTGVNRLIRQGATPVISGQDILEALNLATPENTQPQLQLEQLAPLEKEIYELLMTEPLERDELIQRLNQSVSEINSTLAIMEIKGLIKESLGEIRLG